MKFVFLFAFLFPLFSYSDCCCCCDDPGGEGGEGGGSSNLSCVSMSTDQCGEIKGSLTQWNQQAQDDADNAYNTFLTVIQPHAESVESLIVYILDSQLPRFQSIIEGAESVDSSLSSVYVNLSSCISSIRESQPYWSLVGNGNLSVSNTSSHTVTSVPARMNPNRLFNSALNYLTNSITILSSISIPTNSEVIAEANALRGNMLQSLSTAHQAIIALKTSIDNVESDLVAVSYSLSQSRQYVDAINCAACTSSGGGGGGGGGSGSTVDLTPVINAIHSFQEDVADHIQSIKDLISKLIQDYSSAALASIDREGGPSWTGYNSFRGQNWFKGIEYLLYTVAYPSFQPEDDTTFQPEETSTITSIIDDSDSKVSVMSNEVNSAGVDVEGSALNRLKAKISTLFHTFDRFRFTSFNSTGVSVPASIVVGDFTINPAYVDNSVGSVVDTVLSLFRYAFIALYYVGSVFLVLGLVFVVFRAIGRVLRFLFQLYSSLFGGS